MLKNDIDNIDEVMRTRNGTMYQESWKRIKTALVEAQKQSASSTNTTKAKISALVAGWDAALADKKLQQAEYMAEEMRKLYRRFD